MPDLIEGQKLSAIIFPDRAIYVGTGCCTSIFVSMENGQGAKVPWARADYSIGPPVLCNLALAERVELGTGRYE